MMLKLCLMCLAVAGGRGEDDTRTAGHQERRQAGRLTLPIVTSFLNQWSSNLLDQGPIFLSKGSFIYDVHKKILFLTPSPLSTFPYKIKN